MNRDMDLSFKKRKSDYPTQEEMIELNILRLSGNQRARQEMITRNMPLAMWYACNRVSRNDQNFDDILQECYIGLTKAVDKFDHNRETRNGKVNFPTLAIWWMKSRVNRRYYTDRTIKIDSNIQRNITKIKNASEELEVELSRRPTVDEISSKTNLSKQRIMNLYFIPKISSLNSKINSADDNNKEVIDLIKDVSARSPSEIAEMNDECLSKIEELEDLYMFILRIRKKRKSSETDWLRVFGSRYGIFGYIDGEKTLREVGEEFGMTRERIRQICAKIFRIRANLGRSLSSEKELRTCIKTIRTNVELSVDLKLSEGIFWLIGLDTIE